MISISLCMIVKDEESVLERCLKSIFDIVDEIIIVDTGSTDNTVNIAKKYTSKIYFFKWCDDFSVARNESLKYATKDWILIMDADDELCIEDKKQFKSLIKEDLIKDNVYFFKTISYVGNKIDINNTSTNLNPRLFKNNYGYFYEGEVHNQLVNKSNKVKGVFYPIKVYHYGYLTKNIVLKDKVKRNIMILEGQIKKNTNNRFAYFNLGNEYFSLENEKKALEYYYKAYEEFNPSLGYSYELIEKLVICNYLLKNYDKALKFIKLGNEYYPKVSKFYFIKGIIEKEKGMPILALKSLDKCIKLQENYSEMKFFYDFDMFRVFYEIGNIYMSLKEYDVAYKYYVNSIKLKSDFLMPIYKIMHILKEKKVPTTKRKEIIEGFFIKIPKQNFIIAQLFYKEGYYKIALEYIEKCERENCILENLKIFKVKCLLYTSKFEECIQYIDKNSKDNIYYFQIIMYKILCFILLRKYDLALYIVKQINQSNLLEYNKKILKVYKQLVNIFTNKESSILSEDENETEYTLSIFKIFEVLLVNNKFDLLEKALSLMNLISDKSSLLQLAKLYYKYGYIDMAKKEIIQSIKKFDVLDNEGVEILKLGL